MIRHTVIFRLKHGRGSQQERNFLERAQKLAAIPTVKKFEVLRQVSDKNDYDFGLSMEFDSQDDYDFYSSHEDHEYFVQQYWLKEVESFMEIDYVKV